MCLSCSFLRPFRVPFTAALLFGVTIIIMDFVFCQSQGLDELDEGVCFLERLGMDSSDVYHGRSIERFIVPFLGAGVYILAECAYFFWKIKRSATGRVNRQYVPMNSVA